MQGTHQSPWGGNPQAGSAYATPYSPNGQPANPYATNPAYGYDASTQGSQLAGNAGGIGGVYPPQPGTYYSNTGGPQTASYANTNQNATKIGSLPPKEGGGADGSGGATVQGIPLYASDCDPKAKKFVVQGWKDTWAAILFGLCMLGCFVLGCYNFGSSFGDTPVATPAPTDPDSGLTVAPSDDEGPIFRDDVGLSAGTLVGLLFAIAALAALIATLSLFIFYKFPKQAIIGANVATIILMLVSCVASFAMGSVFAGVLTLIFALVNAWILYAFRNRIPFSALLLKTCTGIAVTFKGLIVANYGLVGLFTIFTIFWSSSIYPSVYRINENNGSANGGDVAILLYAVFCYFWASQVTFNTMHVTASGVTATWYFVGGAPRMPKNPTVASFKRAVTTSFGSVCFGSLLVAILQFLRFVVNSQRENENDFIACIVSCLLRCLESLVSYFNHFAFVYCAIYGYDYVTAAKKTFALAGNCAFAATFNEALVNTTLTITSIGASAIAFVIFWVVANIAVGIVAFVVTLFVHIQLFRIIDSATTTMFICFAEEPNALAAVNPALYEQIYAANAHV